MGNGLFTLLLLCAVMALASFAAGILPLSLNLSPRQLRLITALGTGVLVGTALIVIIPEGIETLYSAEGGTDHNHEERADEHGDTSSHREPHAWIGISLTAGFILMYLVDTLPRYVLRSTKPSGPHHVSLNNFSLASADAPVTPTASSFASAPATTSARPSSTTLGLVIHAAADGIALGASSTSGSSKLGFIIFLALMIHKAPAAFGLTAVLLKQGLSKRTARTHLIVFSLAAPVGAILTWATAVGLGYGAEGEGEGVEFATGVLLLFSGGTFLYVAVHGMMEATNAHDGGNEHGLENGNGYLGVGSEDVYGNGAALGGKQEGPGMIDALVTVGGMLLPLLTQWGHHH